ncbi:MAG: DNA internalization-related competence protein ComEC/Rec2 [Phycisphaerae bacterium]|nr:DNA internalization-related competence protein ComEC/Rec2 [Phycisphaerae bacterium]MDD5381404.1 DNA internalization-related competence protein ComEC/Rec2 [Phycisphaerae bacterium]
MDDIRRKLERIDEQLAGGLGYYHKQIISTAPLLFAAAGLIAGILIQDIFDLSVWGWLAFIGVCTAATILLYVMYRSREERLPYILAYTVLICFVCLGAIRLSSYERPASNDIRNFVTGERVLATIRGFVISKPYINKNENWEFVRFTHKDPTSSFYLKLGEVETVNGWAKVGGTVRVQVDEPVLDLKAGDYIQAYCWLDRFRDATNPGQFDVSQYLARKNVFVAASVKSRDGIELLESKGKGVFTKIRGKFRATAAQALLGDSSIEENNRGLLEALLLGYRGNIGSDTYRAFRKTGLLHFISLSGMHLGILAGIVWWLCKTAGLLKRGRAIICIIALGVFLMIVPPRAPTLRAAIIVFVFCISFFFHRPPNSLNTLSLAAIILLLIRPTQLFGAGWQLSFASVLGLLLFCRRNYLFLYEGITDIFSFKEASKSKPFFQIASRPGPYLLQLFSTGFTAWVGGAGILLYHFYTINPLTVIWTIIVFPLVAGILTFGFVKIILSFLLPSAAMVLGIIVNFLSDCLIWAVKLFAQAGISQILVGHVPITMIIFYYCFILFAFFVYFRRHLLIKKVICTAMILTLVTFLGVTKWQRTHRDNLTITCLDVGHGQAILAQLPGKANILFDAGSLYSKDIGRRIVTPFLDYSGISEIDSIIISHNDVDHINGIPEIAKCCEVGGVYANEAFLDKTDQWGTAKFLKESLSKKGFRIRNLEDFNSNSAANIKILWPSEQVCQDEQLDDNDKSIVCLIEYAGRKILLCSDIEKFAQRELLRLNPSLKADVVVAPHHGSRRTISPDFLKKLDAEILIFSCSRSDREKNRIIKPTGSAKYFYTAEDGAVVVCIEKDGVIR